MKSLTPPSNSNTGNVKNKENFKIGSTQAKIVRKRSQGEAPANGEHWTLLRQNVTVQLSNVQKNLAVSYGLAEYYALTGETFGAGVGAEAVLITLRDFDRRLKMILRCLGSGSRCAPGKRRGSLRLGRASELSAVLADDVKSFAGNILLRPISLEVYTGAKAKDCIMTIEYDNRKSTINGSNFNGKCSRILFDIHPSCIPKVSLIHRKKTMGFFLKEEPQGEVEWTLTHARPLENGKMQVDLSFLRSSCRERYCPTAKAVVQVEWFPKVPKAIEASEP